MTRAYTDKSDKEDFIVIKGLNLSEKREDLDFDQSQWKEDIIVVKKRKWIKYGNRNQAIAYCKLSAVTVIVNIPVDSQNEKITGGESDL